MIRIQINGQQVRFVVSDNNDVYYNGSYRTNQSGEGLWKDEKQILGGTQFSLRGISRSAIRGRIIRMLEA